MSLICDGTSIEAVVFNDEYMTKLQFDDTVVWENPLFYNPLDDGSGYSVRLGDPNITGVITIADTFNGEPVVAIDDDAFKGASGITSLYVPSSITSYGYRFLQGCSGLTNITLPFIDKSLSQYFGSYTGSTDGISINSVTITGGTSICASAFSGCNSITSVQITGTNITSIGEDAFYSCSDLKEVNIPSSVTSIGDNAFTGCKELTTIIIPDNVATIGGNAFGGCSKATIYCEAASQPSGWHNRWNGIESTGNAVPAYFYAEHTSSVGNGTYWHYVNGVPTVWSHSYRSVVTAPTCTAQGYTTYTCSVCGRVYKGDYVAALGHVYSTTKVGATCTEQGYDLHTCIRCDDSYKDNYTAVSGHTWNTATYSWGSDNSTCTATRTCKNDSSHTQTARGNVSSSVTTAATCTTDGTRTYYASFEETWPASQSKAVAIPKTGHTEVIDPAVAATCTTSGKTAGSHCSVCHTILTPQQNIPATGHTWNTPTYSWNGYSSCTATRTCKSNSSHTETATATITNSVIKAATCSATGTKRYTATFPSSQSWATAQTKDETLAKTQHGTSTIIPETAATCTKPGWTSGTKCSVCGEIIEAQQIIPATGHTWQAATCTKPKTCSTCGATEGSALGHTSVEYPEVAPTTTSVGYLGGSYCSVCGTVLTARTKILAYPEFTDVILSEQGYTVDVWVKNNNSLPVTCYLWLEDDSGTVMTEYEFTMAHNESTYKALEYTSSASTPLWVYAFFESVDGDNSYTAEQAVS